MFSPVTLPNFVRARRLQREVDRRLVVLVERGLRAAQVLAGDRRDLADQVVDACRRRRRALGRARARFPCRPAAVPLYCFSRSSFGAPARPRRSSARAGAVVPMISFARSTSVTPGSCTRIWSPCGCCAMLGSVTPSSLTRRSIVCRACIDRLLAQVALDVRLHRERVGAAGERVAIEVGRRDLVGRLRGTPRPGPAARPRRGTSSATARSMLRRR